MKCPICGTNLLHVRSDLFECPQCLFVGSPKNVMEIISYIRKIDAIIETKEDEKEYLLDARREALLKGNAVYLKRVLNDVGLNFPQTTSSSNPVVAKKPSFASTLGLMIASLELGAFMSWFIDNCYELTSSHLPLTQALIPFIILFQALILLVVAWV